MTISNEDFVAQIEAAIRGGASTKPTAKASKPAVKAMFKPVPKGISAVKTKLYSELFPGASGWLKANNMQDIRVEVFEDSDWPEDDRASIPAPFFMWVQHNVFYPFVLAITNNDPLILLTGPTGSGKTILSRYYASVVRQPLTEVNGMDGITPFDWIGSPGTEGNEIVWKDALLAHGYARGHILAIQEPFKVSAGVLMCLMPAAEKGGSMFLYGHPDVSKQRLFPHAKTRLVMADNVRGVGDNVSQYSATNIQDGALLNRATTTIYTPYLEPKEEKALLVKMYPNTINEQAADMLVRLGNLVRGAWDKGEVDKSWSLRTYMAWMEKYNECGSLTLAFRMATGFDSMSDDERGVLAQFWKDVGFEEKLV